jgi:hypothetical protein
LLFLFFMHFFLILPSEQLIYVAMDLSVLSGFHSTGPDVAAAEALKHREEMERTRALEQTKARIVGDIRPTLLVPFAIAQKCFSECTASSQPVGLFRHLKVNENGSVLVEFEVSKV